MIVEAYHYFRTQLNKPETDPGFVYRGVGRLNIVDVTLHRPMDDPQRVFESLNSTGVDLTQSDLIRNYLLMGLPEPEQTRMYDEYWSKVEKLFREAGSSPGHIPARLHRPQTANFDPRPERTAFTPSLEIFGSPRVLTPLPIFWRILSGLHATLCPSYSPTESILSHSERR